MPYALMVDMTVDPTMFATQKAICVNENPDSNIQVLELFGRPSLGSLQRYTHLIRRIRERERESPGTRSELRRDVWKDLW